MWPSHWTSQCHGSSLEVAAMCPHVSVQIPTLRETSVTDFALVRLFPSMCAIVLCEGGAVSKAFATSRTFVWSVS